MGGGPPASRPRRELRSARRLEARPGPAAAHGPAVRPCQPGGRLSETGVAIARACLRRVETVIAFACEKWVFLVQFSGVEVMVVSMVAVQGRAVVLLVSTSPRCRASCAKKFALHTQNTPKSAFLRLLGELFLGRAAEGAVLGEFFRGNAANSLTLGEFFRGRELEGLVWVAGGQSPVFKPPRYPV